MVSLAECTLGHRGNFFFYSGQEMGECAYVDEKVRRIFVEIRESEENTTIFYPNCDWRLAPGHQHLLAV